MISLPNFKAIIYHLFKGSPDNLIDWKAEWLQKAGLNECTPTFDPADQSTEAKVVIKQTSALEEFPTLRHHKMKIAFFDENANIYEEKDVMLKNNSETVVSYDGSKKPKAVLLNYQDEAYIKIRLDENSILFLKEKLNIIPDQLTRAMIWRSLFDMVRDGQLSAYKFIQIVLETVPAESNDTTLNNVLGYVTESFDYSPRVLNDNVLRPKLFDLTLKMLQKTEKSNANRIVLLREKLIGFASFGEKKNIDNISRLINWFEGRDSDLKDVNLEVKDKWTILNKIHLHPKISDSQKSDHFHRIADLDSSDRMKLAEQRCEAMRADESLRKRLFESYLDPDNKLSIKLLQQSMMGFNSSLKMTESDEDAFFDNVLKIFQTRSNEFFSNIL